MENKIKDLKKVELHLHLDGSIDPNTISKITGKTIEDLKDKMIANDKCQNLSEYLTKFDLPISCMQTKENLTLIAKELVDYLDEQNVIYAEIRFAPIFHTNKNLTLDEVIDAVLEGLQSNKNVKTNLILCMMRGIEKEKNLEVIELASKYLNKGVCALDLAGAEDVYPLNLYVDLFKIASSKNIPYTIHAGENGSYKEIELALELRASRIGHGIHATESLELQDKLKDNNILLEVCPTSNVQTNAIDKYNNHPILDFYLKGLKVCINTDNKTVSNVTLNEEYYKLHNTFGFTIEDFNAMNLMAIDGAFLSEEEKEDLKNKILTK